MTPDRPLGPLVEGWQPPPLPERRVIDGRYARLEPLCPTRHAAALFELFEGDDALWDYMPVGPFASAVAFRDWMQGAVGSDGLLFFAIHDKDSGQTAGFAAFLRMQPEAGSTEIGFIAFSAALQRRRAATEAILLMMGWAFEAGYRRVEWKCNALNIASRRAAQRLGFSYEGVFVQATVVKGRNRDTAWFAVIDTDWPALSAQFGLWLSEGNFRADGQQVRRLSDLTGPVRRAADPRLR